MRLIDVTRQQKHLNDYHRHCHHRHYHRHYQSRIIIISSNSSSSSRLSGRSLDDIHHSSTYYRYKTTTPVSFALLDIMNPTTSLTHSHTLHIQILTLHYRTPLPLVMRSVASVCPCLSVLFECSNFWKPWPRIFIVACSHIFRISRSRLYVKVKVTYKQTFTRRLPSIDRQSSNLSS